MDPELMRLAAILLVGAIAALLVQAAGGRPLGKLMATVSLPAVLVPILGPVAGGLIVSNLSWRWIFYVNVPICLVALVLAWRGMSPVRARRCQAVRSRRPWKPFTHRCTRS